MDDVVGHLERILARVAALDEEYPLSTLVGSMYTEFHDIPTPEDINAAIANVTPYEVIRTPESVVLRPNNQAPHNPVTVQDVELAKKAFVRMMEHATGQPPPGWNETDLE